MVLTTDDAFKHMLGFDKVNNSTFGFFLKKFDENNLIQTNVNIPIELFLPTLSNRLFVNIFRLSGESRDFVASATLVSGTTTNYSFTLTTNSEYEIEDSGQFLLNGGAGSDPHILTMSGRHFELPKQTKWWDLVKYRDFSIKGHTTGFKGGYFFNEVVIQCGDKKVRVDFNKGKYSGNIKATERKVVSKIDNLRKSNRNYNIFYIEEYGGIYVLVEYNKRYVFPIFNHEPSKDELKGVLVK